jgi:radical SAM superfamily enzyme YgiQ (UPF0313 family)
MKQQGSTVQTVTLISPAPSYYNALRDRQGPLVQLQRLPRLGLLALEAVTPSAWEVRIIDERIELVEPEKITSPIVGITTMTSMAPRAFALAQKLKACGKTVVLGGFFPTLSPELALAEPCVDSIVIGRGEQAWPCLLNDFAQGTLKKKYCHSPEAHGFTLPQVNYHLTGPELGYNGVLTQIQTSFGCKFSCRFCVIPEFHDHQFVLRDIDDVAAEVADAPTRRVCFVDDNLLNHPTYFGDLCDRLQPAGKGWSAQVSMDIRKHRGLLQKMRRAGCFWLHVGIESLDAAALQAQDKKQNNVQTYLDTLAMIRDEGISISSGMVLGFPTESPDVFERTERFLDRAGLDAVSFHYYTPFPGCPDYDTLAAAGRLVTHDLEHYDTYHAVVRPLNFTHEVLTEKVEALKKRFYRPRSVLARTMRGIAAGYPGVARTFASGALGYYNCRQGLPLYP